MSKKGSRIQIDWDNKTSQSRIYGVAWDRNAREIEAAKEHDRESREREARKQALKAATAASNNAIQSYTPDQTQQETGKTREYSTVIPMSLLGTARNRSIFDRTESYTAGSYRPAPQMPDPTQAPKGVPHREGSLSWGGNGTPQEKWARQMAVAQLKKQAEEKAMSAQDVEKKLSKWSEMEDELQSRMVQRDSVRGEDWVKNEESIQTLLDQLERDDSEIKHYERLLFEKQNPEIVQESKRKEAAAAERQAELDSLSADDVRRSLDVFKEAKRQLEALKTEKMAPIAGTSRNEPALKDQWEAVDHISDTIAKYDDLIEEYKPLLYARKREADVETMGPELWQEAMELADLQEKVIASSPEEPALAGVHQRIEGIETRLREAGVDVESVVEYARRIKNAQERQQGIRDAEAFADEHPVLSSLATIPANLFGGMGYLDIAGQNIANLFRSDEDYIPVDYNRDTSAANLATSAVRARVGQNISEDPNGGAGGNFLYQTAMSILDFTSAAAVGGAAGAAKAIPLTIMSTNAATSATQEAHSRGLSDSEALAIGTVAGLAEIATEKFSLDALLADPKSALSYLAKNIVTEGSEEMASEVINEVADLIIASDKSEFAQAVEAYKAEGMTESEATGRYFGEFLQDVFLSGVAGAISGGVVGGVSVAGNQAIQRTAQNEAQRIEQMLMDAAAERARAESVLASDHTAQESVPQALEESGAADQGFEEIAQEYEPENGIVAPQEARRTQESSSEGQSVDRAISPYRGPQDTSKVVEQDRQTTEAGSVRTGGNTQAEVYAPKASVQRADAVAGTPGGKVVVTGIESVSADDAVLRTSSGKTVNLSDTAFENSAVQALYNEAAQYDMRGANAFLRHYNENLPVGTYKRSFDYFYRAGQMGLPLKQAAANVSVTAQMLGENAFQAAYNTGALAAKAEVSLRKQAALTQKPAGSFIDKNGYAPKAMEEIVRLASKKLGVDIEYVPTLGGANGQYLTSRAKIMIAGDSGNDFTTLLHELGEHIKAQNPEGADNVARALVGWYASKEGYSSTGDFIEQYRKSYERVEGNKTFRDAMDEMSFDMLGGLFGSEEGIKSFLEYLNTDESMSADEKRSVLQRIADVIRRIVSEIREMLHDTSLSKAARAALQMEKEQAESMRELVLDALDQATGNMNQAQKNTATEGSGSSEVKYSFKGYAEDGRGKYESNFPIGTPKKAKGERILRYIQNVWSKAPIPLKIKSEAGERTIYAQFDPTYDAGGGRTDASKLMGGNRHGTSAEQRVTLDLADDYYQIASEATYNYSKEESGKDIATHKGVKQWHYFVNHIYFSEYGSENYAPYRVTINVKERADGEFVYSFSAEKEELSSQRTLHAAVSSNDHATAKGKLSKKETLPQVNPQLHEWLGIINGSTSGTTIASSDDGVNSHSMQNSEEYSGKVRYSINPKFESEYDAWDKKKADFSFKIGTTSDPLKRVGVKNQNIRWDAAKIIKIKTKHPAMTDAVIKQVPSILEYPILIMESQTVPGRLTLFGEVYDANNHSVLVVLELNPTDYKGHALNIIKIASAYGKDTNPQRLIDQSRILYVDPNKNRTNSWLLANRLQLPFASTSYGSIDTISSFDNSVNSHSMQNSEEYSGKVKYSIDPRFAQKYDEWDKQSGRFSFKIGTTSKALESIGVKVQDIRWDATKIKKVREKHPGMTDDVIKQVPNILEYPILIMESKTVPGRLTLFGEVYDANNHPVLAVLELNPVGQDGHSLDIIKIASAYGKDTNPQRLIDQSRILYVDPNKNRTNSWLTVNRLQLPLPSSSYGSIDTIASSDGGVNSHSMQSSEEYSGEVRYSIQVDSGGPYVHVDVDQDIFDGLSMREMREQARKYILSAFRGKVFPVGRDSSAFINGKSANEYANPANRRMPDDLKESKMRASTELDHLLEVSQFLRHDEDDGRHPDATGGWDVYRTRFEVGSEMFAGEVKIKLTDRGRLFYDVTKIERTARNTRSNQDNLAAASGSSSFDTTISSFDNSVNSHSMQSLGDYSGEVRHSLAGIGAQTADRKKLDKAKRMEREGRGSQSIWSRTGWYRGADGQWRFEIDDSKAVFDLSHAPQNGILKDYLKHDALYAAYPELRDVKVQIDDGSRLFLGVNGYYDPQENTIILRRNASKSSLLHEVQHAIQRIEGFATGASLEYWVDILDEDRYPVTKGLRDAQRALAAFRRKTDADTLQLLDQYAERMQSASEYDVANDTHTVEDVERKLEAAGLSDLFWELDSLKFDVSFQLGIAQGMDHPSDLYFNTAGEIEARDVERRANLASGDRQAKKPDTGDERAVFAGETKENYAINPDFAMEIDAWSREGRDDGERFILGSTGDVFQGLGARENDIYLLGEKVNKILKDHPEMTLEEIKRIPEILDDPVLVLASRNLGRTNQQNSRLVVFGSVKAQNGIPVMSILDLQPVEGKIRIEDMQKLVSSYTKNFGAKSFFYDSDVLYVCENKRRTSKLLSSVGLQIRPTEVPNAGSIGSIAYERNHVKLSGVPFSKLFGGENTPDIRYSLKENYAINPKLKVGSW